MVSSGTLGKVYRDGEAIVRQGDTGDCMYVVQSGQVEVVQGRDGQETRLAVLGPEDLFGEMALFESEVRVATVRALGEAVVLTVDKRLFMRRLHEDPSLVFRILQKLSQRIRALDAELVRLKHHTESVPSQPCPIPAPPRADPRSTRRVSR